MARSGYTGCSGMGVLHLGGNFDGALKGSGWAVVTPGAAGRMALFWAFGLG